MMVFFAAGLRKFGGELHARCGVRSGATEEDDEQVTKSGRGPRRLAAYIG
jgi:hypothetical protein